MLNTTLPTGLSPAQLREYNETGFLVLESFLDQEELRPAREAMMEKTDEIAAALFQAGLISDLLKDEPFPTRLARLFDGLEDRHFLQFGRGWRDRKAGYFHLMCTPKILDVIECLIGPEIFSNPVYNVRPKVPRVAAGAVPWHQDKSYWPDANANPVITVWIPLVDSNLENGCLHLIPGTHKRRVIPHGKETYSGTGFLEVPAEYMAKRSHEVLPLPMEAGSAVFFNDRLIHSSTPNNSRGVRWSVDLRYQPTNQDPMPQHGIGFLARSRQHPDRVATLQDWLDGKPERESSP